jgi:hypothetical protein
MVHCLIEKNVQVHYFIYRLQIFSTTGSSIWNDPNTNYTHFLSFIYIITITESLIANCIFEKSMLKLTSSKCTVELYGRHGVNSPSSYGVD